MLIDSDNWLANLSALHRHIGLDELYNKEISKPKRIPDEQNSLQVLKNLAALGYQSLELAKSDYPEIRKTLAKHGHALNYLVIDNNIFVRIYCAYASETLAKRLSKDPDLRVKMHAENALKGVKLREKEIEEDMY